MFSLTTSRKFLNNISHSYSSSGAGVLILNACSYKAGRDLASERLKQIKNCRTKPNMLHDSLSFESESTVNVLI